MPGEAEEGVVGGRYRLDKLVGQGGLGRVWLGHDRLLDRAVAVKEVLLPHYLSAGEHAELVARAMREAKAAARLSHPNVITIHDVVEQDGAPWIVMEFVSGRSLEEEIKDRGRLPWQRAAEIGAAVAAALDHAHAEGIIHRDLKPANIMLAGRRVVVIDFGLAHVLDATTKLTKSGAAPGTLPYMAPEQVEGTAGVPADLWALGVTLYEAVEGSLPFDGPTLTSVIASILARPPAQPRYAGPLHDLLLALLSKDPVSRPDVPAIRSELSKATHAASITARVEELVETGDEHYGQGRSVAAEVALREAIGLDPGHAGAHFSLGLVLWNQERLEEAEGSFREVIRIDLTDAGAHSNLGTILLARGQLKEAEAELREAIRCDPQLAVAHYSLGRLLRAAERLEESEAQFREVIRLDPANADAHFSLGLMQHEGRPEEAEAAYREVIRLRPQGAAAQNNLGLVLQDQDRLEEATAAFREAVRLDPEDPTPRYNLVRLLTQEEWGDEEGNLEEAEAQLREIIRLSPEDAGAHFDLGTVLSQLGWLLEAEAQFRDAIRLSPGDAEAHYSLGQLMQKANRLTEAEAEFREAIRLAPGDFGMQIELEALLRSL